MRDQQSLFGDFLDPEVDRVFRELAVPVKQKEVPSLIEDIRRHLHMVARAGQKNEFLNEPLGQKDRRNKHHVIGSCKITHNGK